MEKKSKNNKNAKENPIARIKVIGVGGAGGNAVSRMYEDFPRGIDLIVINTDIQDLEKSNARKKVYIGKNITKGLGTGMNPDLGRQAAEENRAEITDAIKDSEMIFIAAGFGGGTGTGAAPVVAEIAKELGILTVAIITKPFSFEGGQRARIAEEGIIKLQDRVDTLITIPNDRIFSVISKDTSLMKAFEEVDKILNDSVKGITELILTPGIINIDFADIKAIMRDAGSAMVGIGVGSGQQGRAAKAAQLAINSPLLETSIEGAKGILFSISGRNDLKMHEINEIASQIAESADPGAKIIFGTYYDRKLNKGQLKITIIATGFSGMLVRDSRFVSSLFTATEEFSPSIQDKPLPFSIPDSSESAVAVVKETKKDEAKTESKAEAKGKKKDFGGFMQDENRPSQEEAEDEKEKEWEIPAFLRRKRR